MSHTRARRNAPAIGLTLHLANAIYDEARAKGNGFLDAHFEQLRNFVFARNHAALLINSDNLYGPVHALIIVKDFASRDDDTFRLKPISFPIGVNESATVNT
ncbi:hypothetical protein D3C86_2013280 [compost metagenome]